MGNKSEFVREEKVAAVRLVTDGGRTVLSVANEYGVHENTVLKWKRQYKMNPELAFSGDNAQTSPDETERMRRRIRELENEVWVSDFTCIRTDEGWLYLRGVLDICSRRVVGCAVSETIDRCLAVAALDDAVKCPTRPPAIPPFLAISGDGRQARGRGCVDRTRRGSNACAPGPTRPPAIPPFLAISGDGRQARGRGYAVWADRATMRRIL